MPKVSDEYFEQKRKEIVDAAYRVCMKKPITSVEMKDIIAETGFSHGVIYRYYSELDEVLQDLVIRINRSNRIDERLMEILDRYKIGEWKRTVKEVCGLLASYLEETEIDILKLSIYSDVLAMNDPKRVMRIASRLDKDDRSPLLILEMMMRKFLERVVHEEKLHPIRSTDEILQFMIVTFHGIQTGYVLSNCYQTEHITERYKPAPMFDCLADSVIYMMGG